MSISSSRDSSWFPVRGSGFVSARRGIDTRPGIAEVTDFRFFVPAELIKSGEGEERRLVGGTISTEDWDLQKEKVLQKGIDWSYVESGNGVLKWEHSPDDPANIIGFPLEIIKGERETMIIGELFKGHKKADDAWSLLKAIDAYNREHPDSPGPSLPTGRSL